MSADWREKKMEQIRKLIKEADPNVTEEMKWKKASNPDGIPVWYDNGMICTGETYKDHLRLTFAKGNILKNNSKLFNNFRAIVIREEDKIDEASFKNLIRAAVKSNLQ